MVRDNLAASVQSNVGGLSNYLKLTPRFSLNLNIRSFSIGALESFPWVVPHPQTGERITDERMTTEISVSQWIEA